MPLLKQFARLGVSLSKLSDSSSRSASGMRPGRGLTARLQCDQVGKPALCMKDVLRAWWALREVACIELIKLQLHVPIIAGCDCLNWHSPPA